MAFAWNTTWTAVDTAPDGRMLAVKVRSPRSPRGRPEVIKFAQSSPVAMGDHALGELAGELGGGSWTYPLARGDYQMLVLPKPPVLEDEIEASLRWTIAGMIDYPIDEASVSWMHIPTAEFDPAKEQQLYVIVARRSIVQEQSELFSKAKLALKAVDVRETALRNIAALVEKRNEGIGLLTIGSTGVTTTFTYRGELYLDRFIAQNFDEIATDTGKQQKFFERVAQQVAQSLELLSRNYPFLTVNRLVLAPLPGPLSAVGYLKERLSVPVEQLDLSAFMDLSSVPQLSKAENQSRYLVAIGAALRGMTGAAA